MNATMSKQEANEAYIKSVQGKIYERNGLYHVPSSKDGEYIVTVKDGKAYDCGCYDCYRDNGQRNYCKHREAVDTFIARQNEQVKEPVIRHLLKEINYAFYTVLDDASQEYHQIDMQNGRAKGCIDHLGNKCQQRRNHPSVPCVHMYKANLAEEKHRRQELIDARVQQYGFSGSTLVAFKLLVAEEQDKCTEAFRAVMRQPIDEIEGTSDWFKAAEKREKEANKARLKQRKISQERINAFIGQQQLEVAA